MLWSLAFRLIPFLHFTMGGVSTQFCSLVSLLPRQSAAGIVYSDQNGYWDIVSAVASSTSSP